MKQPDQILTLSAGPSQLISAICDEIGFEETINEQLDWDKDRCHLSPGARIKALVINILCGKEPLYHIHHFFKEQDVEMLFGSHVKAEDLNEYSIGRALDALYKAIPMIRAGILHSSKSYAKFFPKKNGINSFTKRIQP